MFLLYSCPRLVCKLCAVSAMAKCKFILEQHVYMHKNNVRLNLKDQSVL